LVHSDLTEEKPKLEKVTKNKYIFVLNEAKNEQKFQKTFKKMKVKTKKQTKNELFNRLKNDFIRPKKFGDKIDQIFIEKILNFLGKRTKND